MNVVQSDNSTYSSPHCLVYPNYSALYHPAVAAGVSGGASHPVSVLTSAAPHSTAAMPSSCSTVDTTSNSAGDYQVRNGELIASAHSYYQVLEPLGRGTFGQVLKCWKKDSNEVVAMKILKNLPSYSKQGQVEVDVLTTLNKVDAQQFNFVRAYESFTHQSHICIVFELLHINLYDYLKQNRFQPLPLKHIRPIAQQVLTCLKALRDLRLVHADLKPENIMLVDPDRQPFRVKVIDFGSATTRSTSLSSTYLQSRYYRAPEVILGVPYDEAIDMWSLGCVLAELFLGWPLFPGATEYDQMMYITQLVGGPPATLTKNLTKMNRFFRREHTASGTRRWELKPQALVQLETGVCPKETRKFIFTSVAAIGQVSCTMTTPTHLLQGRAQSLDKAQFISLLEMLLTFDPQKRADPDTCLQHSFITMLHLSSHTDTHCVRDWIQCMQVCCQSRTTYSAPSALPHNHHLHSQVATPTQTHPQLHLALDSTLPCNSRQPYFLPQHCFSTLTQPPPPNSSTFIVAPPTNSTLLVDTGYVSADSSPTLHTVWDFPKLPVVPALPPHTTTAAATLVLSAPAAAALTSHHLPQPPSLLVSPSNAAATTYWLMLQQSGYLATHSQL